MPNINIMVLCDIENLISLDSLPIVLPLYLITFRYTTGFKKRYNIFYQLYLFFLLKRDTLLKFFDINCPLCQNFQSRLFKK